MTPTLRITRAGPLTTVQDAGRFDALRHGISASGPMDRRSWVMAWEGGMAGSGLEFTTAGLDFDYRGPGMRAATGGGAFTIAVNGAPADWAAPLGLKDRDRVTITPGRTGNYGYLRFERDIDVPIVIGSRATNLTAGLGGHEGRALHQGDVLRLAPVSSAALRQSVLPPAPFEGTLRIVWGIHADLFDQHVRLSFLTEPFTVSPMLDRMGVRLNDASRVFAADPMLSLVSDSVVPGDIQILGDGTPIVLMRDHQPTGGYPRIATIVSADFDTFAQLRPGTAVRFSPVTVEHAHALLRKGAGS